MKVKFSSLVNFAVSLPLCSILACIFISMVLHWEDATSTHCKVNNYLPSISAAVGSLTPERYIWRAGIALHSLLRYLFAVAYYNFYQDSSLSKWFSVIIKFNLVFNTIEVSCLMLLTYVSSTENYDVHKSGFIGFLVCSLLHMTCTCYLFIKLGNIRHSHQVS